MALTKKQKIFADEYVIDLNATRAYRVAYPSVKKEETAAVNGSRMLRNAKVAEYIQKRMQDRQKRTEDSRKNHLHGNTGYKETAQYKFNQYKEKINTFFLLSLCALFCTLGAVLTHSTFSPISP